MKLNNAKRTAAAVLSAAVLLGMVGCGAASSASGASSSTASSAASSEAASSEAVKGTGAYKTGFGVVVGTKVGDDKVSGTINNTVVAVILDGEGKIVSAVVDVAQNKLAANEDGTLNLAESYSSKQELGTAYGMVKASAIGKEWNEQADFFAAYIVGKTADEVAGIPTDGSDADLAAGCTVGVEEFIEATVKACENAAELGAGEGDTVALGIVSANGHGNADATAEAEGKAEVDSTFVAVTKNADGVVTSAVCDMVQPTYKVAVDGSLTAPEAVQSKLELGDAYGMKKASAIGKEWFEQSAGFCAYLTGKDAAAIGAIPADGSDADLAASCTVGISDMLNAAVKAAQ